jgi:glycosyltransferase involved in cell wall biosynthesis
LNNQNKRFLVSVLIINYNKAIYVSRCLNSLIKQNYRKFEVIFSDDNSNDNSIAIASKYKKKLNIKIVRGKKKTKYGSYNQMNSILRAFNQSSGTILLFLDSDDFFHKNKISSIVKFFNHFNEKKIIFDLPYIYYSKNKIKKFNIKKKFSNKIWPKFPPQSCISMRRDYFVYLYPKIYFKKFFNIWFDFRVAFFSNFISKNFEILNKRLTYYFIDPSGISAEFKYLTFNWWRRRLEAFKFYHYLFKKFLLKFPITIDYIVTIIIVKTFVFFKGNDQKNKIIN